MNRDKKQSIYNDMVKGKRPTRFPMDIVGHVEYRKDIYNQGEPDINVAEGEITQSVDGSKKYTKDGGIWDVSSRLSYYCADDVINVDLNRFVVEDVDESMFREMKKLLKKKNKTHVTVPWHYGTLMTRCQIAFGWEPLLEASALEPEALKPIIDRIGQSTLQVLDGWSRIDGVDLIIVHDDIASTQGLIWSPQFLRKYVFEWYRRFFDKIHENGKKALYITDGNYIKIIDELLAMKPDGLYIESASIDPAAVMARGGREMFYLLKTNARTMDFGTEEDIKNEVLKLRDLHRKYPKIFSYRGGGLVNPKNVDIFNKYYDEFLIYEK